MRKIEIKTRKLLRTIFGGISFTAMAFVFQACYGPAPERYPDSCYEVKLSGTVTSKGSNLPAKGIKIAVSHGINYTFTDENGEFGFYVSLPKESMSGAADSIKVYFLDIDGVENGNFTDQTIVIDPMRDNEVIINVALEEKQ